MRATNKGRRRKTDEIVITERCDSCELLFPREECTEWRGRMLCRECNEQRIMSENQPFPGDRKDAK